MATARNQGLEPQVALRMLALAFLAVCASASTPSLRLIQVQPTHVADPAHSPDMFTQLQALHTAIIHGDLAALHIPATWLAEQRTLPSSTTQARRLDEQLKQAAARAAAAVDVAAAADAAADVIASCGACHEAAGIVPTLPPVAGSSQTNIVGHMRRHAQAAEEMMHGMVAPSKSVWLQGTIAFAEMPLEAGDFPVDFERGARMARLDAEVHRLAQNAFAAETLSARARAYGQLLGTCAQCHQQHARP
jgi:hypothetical protein